VPVLRRGVMRILLAMCAICAGAGAVRGAPTGVEAGNSEAAARAAIEQAWSRHIAAAQAGNLDGVMEIYAADVVYVAADGQTTRGAAAVRAQEAESLATSTLLHAEHVVRGLIVAGEVAYELGTVRGPIRAGDAEPVEVRYDFMAQWRRDPSAQWRIGYLVGTAERGDPKKP